MFVDGYFNAVAHLGTERDKAAFSRYGFTRLTDDELRAAYRGAWLPRKIVDIVPFDATRRWRAWQAERDQISAIEAEEKRLGLQAKVMRAMIAARLWGAAALYISDGSSDPSLPFGHERVRRGGIRHLTVLTRRELSLGDRDDDLESERFGQPEFYEINSSKAGAVRIHPSRLAMFHGSSLPDGDGFGGMEWPDSVLQPIYQATLNADAVTANVAALVFEAKVDILRIPKLLQMLEQPGGEERVRAYLRAAALGKAINGALVLDGGDENQKPQEYDQKSANFANLPDVMDRFMQLVCGASDIPATRLLGISPAGMNSTGESDIRNYYDRVAAMQSLEMQPAMSVLDEALIRSALGARPDDIFFDWRSLWQPTEKERAEVGKITAETIKALVESGLYPPELLAEAGANAMIEASALPGLEAAIDEYGLGVDAPDADDDLDAMTE